MNGPDASARQHGDDAFQRQRHVDDDTIAFLHAQRLQPVGEAAYVPVELPVGNKPLLAILGEPDESHPITVLRIGVAVECIHRDVGARPSEPLMMNAVPLKNLVPGFRPDKLAGNLGPEGIRIFAEALLLGWPVLHQRLFLHNCRSRIFLASSFVNIFDGR